MLMRYNDGDQLVLLPVSHNDGRTSFMVQATFFYCNPKLVWDTSGILHQAYMVTRKSGLKSGSYGRVYLCGAKNRVTGQIGIVKLGVTLKRKIDDYLANNGDAGICLNVKSRLLTTNGTMVPIYDESFVSSVQPESIDPAKWSSLNIDDFISRYGLERNWDLVERESGGILSEIRRQNRDERLEEIGI